MNNSRSPRRSVPPSAYHQQASTYRPQPSHPRQRPRSPSHQAPRSRVVVPPPNGIRRSPPGRVPPIRVKHQPVVAPPSNRPSRFEEEHRLPPPPSMPPPIAPPPVQPVISRQSSSLPRIDPRVGPGAGPCWSFMQGVPCKFGDRCRFAHVAPSTGYTLVLKQDKEPQQPITLSLSPPPPPPLPPPPPTQPPPPVAIKEEEEESMHTLLQTQLQSMLAAASISFDSFGEALVLNSPSEEVSKLKAMKLEVDALKLQQYKISSATRARYEMMHSVHNHELRMLDERLSELQRFQMF